MRIAHLLPQDKCHVCLYFDDPNPGDAISRIWVHQAFGNAECYHIPICKECLDMGFEEDKQTTSCPNCR